MSPLVSPKFYLCCIMASSVKDYSVTHITNLQTILSCGIVANKIVMGFPPTSFAFLNTNIFCSVTPDPLSEKYIKSPYTIPIVSNNAISFNYPQ